MHNLWALNVENAKEVTLLLCLFVSFIYKRRASFANYQSIIFHASYLAFFG